MKKLLFTLICFCFINTIFGAITLTPTAVDTGYCQSDYRQKITASGGVAPYAYSISSGTLPAGLKIAKETGLITGIIKAVNDTAITFTVRAMDKTGGTGTRSYTMYIRNRIVTWQSLVESWNKMPNTYPTPSAVYNTYRLSANNTLYSYADGLILPLNKDIKSSSGYSKFDLGITGNYRFYLSTSTENYSSEISGTEKDISIYTNTPLRESGIFIDSSKVSIYSQDSIYINAPKIKFNLADLPADSTGLSKGTLYRSGSTLKIKF